MGHSSYDAEGASMVVGDERLLWMCNLFSKLTEPQGSRRVLKMSSGFDLFTFGRKRSMKIWDGEETRDAIVAEQGESHLRSKRPCLISDTHGSKSVGNDMEDRQAASQFPGNSEVTCMSKYKEPLAEAAGQKDVGVPHVAFYIPVLVKGLNADADWLQVSLYNQLVKHFGPLLQSDSPKWRLSGDTGVLLFKKLLDMVKELKQMQPIQLNTEFLDSWDFQLARMEGVGLSVGWFRSYLARVRQLRCKYSYLAQVLHSKRVELKKAEEYHLMAQLFNQCMCSNLADVVLSKHAELKKAEDNLVVAEQELQQCILFC